MNYVKFQCYEGFGYTDQDCTESQKARTEFKFLLEKIHKEALDASLRKLSSKSATDLEYEVLKYIGQTESSNEWDIWGRSVEHSEKFFQQLLHYARSDSSSCSSISTIREKLIDFIITTMGKFQSDPKEYLIGLEQSITDPQCNQNMPNNISICPMELDRWYENGLNLICFDQT